MPESKFKKDVPESRTVVPGVWSDLLDDASVSFDSEGNLTSVRVNLKNLSELSSLLAVSLSRIHDQNQDIIDNLKLLNLRFEEMADTKLNMEDIGEDDG